MSGTTKTRAALEALFEAGDKPSAADFADLLASQFNLTDDDVTDILADNVITALFAGIWEGLPLDPATSRARLSTLLGRLASASALLDGRADDLETRADALSYATAQALRDAGTPTAATVANTLGAVAQGDGGGGRESHGAPPGCVLLMGAAHGDRDHDTRSRACAQRFSALISRKSGRGPRRSTLPRLSRPTRRA